MVLLIKIPRAAASLCVVESPQVPSSRKASPLLILGVELHKVRPKVSEVPRQLHLSLSQAGGGRKEETFDGEVAIINFLCVCTLPTQSICH